MSKLWNGLRCSHAQLAGRNVGLAARSSSPVTSEALLTWRARAYSSSTGTSKTPSKSSKRWRRLGIVVAGSGLVLLWDQEFNASAIVRTLRTGYNGVVIAADFKFNFNPGNSEAIDQLHERIAHRMHTLCVTNKGLYIKLGQALGLQAAVLPKPYRDAFSSIFDDAPTVSKDQVIKVFKEEFGVTPEEAFDSFDYKAIASASIAQVHKARLKRKPGQTPWKDDEGWVAVKVRKPDIPIQLEWDLFSYRALMWTYEKLFDFPISFISNYISQQMRHEVDLKHEAHNAERAARDLATEPSLRDRVRIPKVYWEWTGESIMTADFVKAVKLTDKAALDRLGLSPRACMDAANAFVAAQTFKHGFIHCDPHPGNLLVMQHPRNPRKPLIVVIDHGLYVELDEEFRKSYCLLWRSLFTGDIATVENIVQKWGIAKENAELFSSMTLLRPHKLRKDNKERQSQQADNGAGQSQSTYEQQVGLKERIRSMLEAEELIPRPLIFITRSMRMMQANNQSLGSPSNRINANAHWAAAGLELSLPANSSTLQQVGLRRFAIEKARTVVFRLVLWAIDIGFAFTQFKQWLVEMFGGKSEGFEDLLQRQVTEMAREVGVEIDDDAFMG
ncbi:hypothetical protein OIO90_005456 [Microbotryomycetes sp. JL221]|nr:hypothetical protein OIO90_005456 [Microbotryomycetes sp. JL221]